MHCGSARPPPLVISFCSISGTMGQLGFVIDLRLHRPQKEKNEKTSSAPAARRVGSSNGKRFERSRYRFRDNPAGPLRNKLCRKQALPGAALTGEGWVGKEGRSRRPTYKKKKKRDSRRRS